MSKYVSIATQVLANSSTTSLSFTGISGSYKDLRLVITGAMATTSDNMLIRFNSDSGASSYVTQSYTASGASNSAAHTTGNGINGNVSISAIASGLSMTIIDIFNYTNTSKVKSGMLFTMAATTSNKTLNQQGFYWANTSNAITEINILTAGAKTYAINSVFALYGIG